MAARARAAAARASSSVRTAAAARASSSAAAAKPKQAMPAQEAGAGEAASDVTALEAELLRKEAAHGAQNYPPAPVVISRARGATVWDVRGRRFFDFLAGYSAVSQGHCHPRIISALSEQAKTCTLTSRAFHNDKWPLLAEHLSRALGYEAALPMNSGAEAVETAVKLAKKWAFEVKGVADGEQLIASACGCFHGRTAAAISMSCDPDATTGFAPLLPGTVKVPFGDAEALRGALERFGERIAAFVVEPIQGEGGVVLPPEGYFAEVRRLCDRHNVLLVADEVQTGLGRTGHMLAIEAEGVRPDVVVLGKALSGGVLPVSAVVADWRVMNSIKPGEHGSTFGGSPLGAAVALEALKVLQDERLVERSAELGEVMLERLSSIATKDASAAASSSRPALVLEQRGRGLFAAVDVGGAPHVNAYDACDLLRERGVLTKPTQRNTIRLAPPLVIAEEELAHAMDQFEAVFLSDLPALYERRRREVVTNGEVTKFAAPAPRPCNRCGKDLESADACHGNWDFPAEHFKPAYH